VRKVAEYVNLIQDRSDGPSNTTCSVAGALTGRESGRLVSAPQTRSPYGSTVFAPLSGPGSDVGPAFPVELPEAAPRRFGQRLQGNLEGDVVPPAGPVCEVRGGNCQLVGVVPDLTMS